jgi:hypothetical protein
MKMYIQSVTGKANKKDIKTIQKFAPDLKFDYDEMYNLGWSADIDTVQNGELLAMRLRNVLSKKYFMGLYEGRTKINSIDLF